MPAAEWIGVGRRLIELYRRRPGKLAISGHREGYVVEVAETVITGSDGPDYRVDGNKLAYEGIFHNGLIRGKFDGRLDGRRVLFSFEASDEMEPVHGAGRMSPLYGRM